MTARQANSFLASAALHGAAVVLLVYFSLAARREVAFAAPAEFVAILQEASSQSGPVSSSERAVSVVIPKAPAPAPAPSRVAETDGAAPVTAPLKPRPSPAGSRAPHVPQAATAVTNAAVAPVRPAPNGSGTRVPSVAAPGPRIDQNWAMQGGTTIDRVPTNVNSGPGLRADDHALLKQRLKDALGEPEGIDADLTAVVELRIAADGRLTQVKLVRSSGDGRFDRAVLDAIARTRMPRPAVASDELLLIPFTTRGVVDPR